jgi:hypothetical protein
VAAADDERGDDAVLRADENVFHDADPAFVGLDAVAVAGESRSSVSSRTMPGSRTRLRREDERLLGVVLVVCERASLMEGRKTL